MSLMYERGVSQQQQQQRQRQRPDTDPVQPGPARPGPAELRTHYIRFNSRMLVTTTTVQAARPMSSVSTLRRLRTSAASMASCRGDISASVMSSVRTGNVCPWDAVRILCLCFLGPPVAITQPRPLCFAAVSFFFLFFIQREISAVSRPIAAKLCHMIGNGCNFKN